ncbi:ATP-dependent protease, partial [Variovorax sp. WS11]
MPRKVWIRSSKFALFPFSLYVMPTIILLCPGGFMSLAIVYTRAALGIEAPLITVEVHL